MLTISYDDNCRLGGGSHKHRTGHYWKKTGKDMMLENYITISIASFRIKTNVTL